MEVLNQIFDLVKQSLEDHTFLPQFPLTPLIRVCKSWRPVAERLLYESISIGSHFFKYTDFYYADVVRSLDMSGHELSFKDKLKGLASLNTTYEQIAKPKVRCASVFVQQLLETLENSKRLVDIVKELRIISIDESVEKSHNHALVLAACPNVLHVEIRYGSFNLLARKIIVNSLETRSLVSLKVCCFREDEGLLEVSTLLRLMTNWPDIELVQISPYALLYNDPEDDVGDVEPGCCSKLEVFDMQRSPAVLRPCDLRNFLRMCPAGIKIFRAPLAIDGGMHAVLQACLHAWAPTLETLDLRGSCCYDAPAPASILGLDGVAGLSKLTVLALQTLNMDSHALSTLPNLAELTVEQSSLSECRAMIFALKDFRNFPALRHIYMARPYYVDMDDPLEAHHLKMTEEVSCIRGFPIYV